MLKNKTALLFLTLYLFVTTILYIKQPQAVKTEQLQFFYNDPNIQGRLRDEIAYDHNGNTVLVTRLYHNKVIEKGEVFFTNLYRTADLPFLFSLTHMSTMNDNRGRIPMMYPFELPFFLLASWHLIRHWGDYRRQYRFLIPLLLAALAVTGLFSPAVHVIKTLPLVIAMRLITFIGMYEFITHSRWVKRFYSFS